MRVFIAALAHETNSFSPIPTSMQSYVEGVLFRPSEAQGRDPETAFIGYGDFARLARERGHERILSIAALAQPSAPTVRRDYEALRDEILGDLKAAMPVDMVMLMMHGSQMADGYDDCEGDLLTRVREMVGERVPIGLELDLHCNITPAMLQAATAIIPCKEYPHTDFPERAVELFDIIENAARGKSKPFMVHRRVPMLSKFHTTREPVRSFVDAAAANEGKNGILSVGLAHGFLWGDMPAAGASVVIVADGERAQAEQLRDTLAEQFYALRRDIYDRYLSIADLIARVKAAKQGPIVVSDGSDNPGGGAPGDSTFILRALLDAKIENAALAMIWDPVAVDLATHAGVGARLAMRIGGKSGPASGDPIDGEATILALAEKPTQRGLEANRREALGRCAAIRIGGVDVVLNSRRQQTFSPDCFTQLGIDPSRKNVVVVKSSQHFYAQFGPMASEVVYCNAPGALDTDFGSLPFKKLQRPIWPIDEIDWRGEPA